jgi:DNA-binding NarL/FixJ family response regulator
MGPSGPHDRPRAFAAAGLKESALRLLVVSDTRLLRDALATGLSAQPGLALVGAVAATDAPEAIGTALPDAVVVEAGVRGGPQVIGSLKRQEHAAPIIVCAIGENAAEALDWLHAGASGCACCEDGAPEIAGAVRRAVKGEIAFTPLLAVRLLGRMTNQEPAPVARRHVHDLTPRESEIGALLLEGLSNKEIGRRLSISEATVKNHVHSILEKLGVRSRWQAAAHLRTAPPSGFAERTTHGVAAEEGRAAASLDRLHLRGTRPN